MDGERIMVISFFCTFFLLSTLAIMDIIIKGVREKKHVQQEVSGYSDEELMSAVQRLNDLSRVYNRGSEEIMYYEAVFKKAKKRGLIK